MRKFALVFALILPLVATAPGDTVWPDSGDAIGVTPEPLELAATCFCWTAQLIIDNYNDCSPGTPNTIYDSVGPNGFAFISCDTGSVDTTYVGSITDATPSCEVTTDTLNGPVAETGITAEEMAVCYAELVTAEGVTG